MKSNIKVRFPQLVVISFCLLGAALAQSTEECRVPGDPDILGLGTRLGLYFQVLSSLLIGISRPEESADSVLPTGLFLTGFLVAVIYSTALNDFPPGATISCTWYPVLVLIAMIPTNFGSPADPGKSYRRSMLSTILYLTSGCLNSWFWFKGLDAVNPHQCMTPRVFFFANLSAYGRSRTLFKIFCLAFIIILTLSFGVGLILGARSAQSEQNAGDEQENIELGAMTPPAGNVKSLTPEVRAVEPSTTEPSASILLPASQAPPVPFSAALGSTELLNLPETSPAPSAAPLINDEAPSNTVTGTPDNANLESSTLLAAQPESSQPIESNDGKRDMMPQIWKLVRSGLFWMVIYIIASELQLKWNHLDGINSVNTTGQIIPLALGTLSLGRSIWLLKDVNWRQIVHQRHVHTSEVFWEATRRINSAAIPSRWR